MPPFSLKNATRTQISIRSSITIHFLHRCHTGVTPATYRLDAFRINYRKGDLIGTYVYFAFQKPFRESPSSGTSHSRSRGQLHDRNEKTAATKIPRSAGNAARLCARYHLPSSLDGAECKSDSLVGGNSKRMTLPPLSSSCMGSDSRRVISPSLTTPNFSVRRRMMPSPPSKAAFPLALPAPLSAPYMDAHRASYAKTQKERQDPRNRKSSLGNAPQHRPCHRHHALWE